MKILVTLTLLTASPFLATASTKLSNITISESIKNIFGPNVNVSYKKFDIDHSIDLVNKSGHINVNIYPGAAVSKPQFYNSIIKGKDVFDVANYKVISFKSNKVNFTEDNKIGSISGVLTVRNQSTPVTFKANSFTCKGEVGARTCTTTFVAPFDRTKVGITYGTKIGLSKQAPITFKLNLKEE